MGLRKFVSYCACCRGCARYCSVLHILLAAFATNRPSLCPGRRSSCPMGTTCNATATAMSCIALDNATVVSLPVRNNNSLVSKNATVADGFCAIIADYLPSDCTCTDARCADTPMNSDAHEFSLRAHSRVVSLACHCIAPAVRCILLFFGLETTFKDKKPIRWQGWWYR